MKQQRIRRLRTGRKVGRTIYAQVGRDPSDDDVLVGVMDTAELAEALVNSWNFCISADRLDRRVRHEEIASVLLDQDQEKGNGPCCWSHAKGGDHTSDCAMVR